MEGASEGGAPLDWRLIIPPPRPLAPAGWAPTGMSLRGWGATTASTLAGFAGVETGWGEMKWSNRIVADNAKDAEEAA